MPNKADLAQAMQWRKQQTEQIVNNELAKLGIPRLFVYGVIKSITVAGQSGGLSVADVYLNGATTASTNIPVNPDVAPHLSAGDPVWVIRVNFDSRDMFVLCRHNGNNNITVGGSGNDSGYITVKDTYGHTIVTLDNNGIKMYDTNGLLRFWSIPNNSGGGSSMGTTEAYGALYAQSTTNYGTTNAGFFGALTNDGVNVFWTQVDGSTYSKGPMFVGGDYAGVALNNGYQYFQSGIVSTSWQLNGTPRNGNFSVSFPTAFNANCNVRIKVSLMGNTDPLNWYEPSVANQTPTGFDVYQRVPASSSISQLSYAYVAVGYI